MKKTTQLKNMLDNLELEFLMEAHNGLSARIVEQSGFKGVWASGLSISASLGVRDNNEASWTQVLEVAEFMSDCTAIPILRTVIRAMVTSTTCGASSGSLNSGILPASALKTSFFPKPTASSVNASRWPVLRSFAAK